MKDIDTVSGFSTVNGLNKIALKVILVLEVFCHVSAFCVAVGVIGSNDHYNIIITLMTFMQTTQR